MSTVHFPNTVFAISKLNSTFRAMSFGGGSGAVHQLAVHTVRDRESGVRAGRVTPPNRPFLEPSVRGRSRVWGGGTGRPAQSVRLWSGLPFVHVWIVML